MDRSSNIFYKVTREHEDTASELLCNIFRTKYIRDICLDFFGIPPKAYETITINDIETRKSIDTGGIPDIIIENENSFFLIENKIRVDTPLQNSQITTYLEHINNKSKTFKGYIFLIPENYEHEIEIKEIETDETKESYPFIKKKYWGDFLRHLYSKEIHNESPVISEVMDYLKNLTLEEPVIETKLEINEVVIMYNPKDIYNALSFVDKINVLVGNVSEKIVEKLGPDFAVDRKQTDIDGQGKYLKYKDYGEVIFIGLSPCVYEEQNGDFVYSVAFTRKFLNENLKINIDKYPYFDDKEGGCIFIELDRKTLVDDDQEKILTNTVVDIIKNVFLKNWKGS
jgi:hypothetical protein